MVLSTTPLHHFIPFLLLLTPATLAQTSTVVVLPTPVTGYDAAAQCQQMGYIIYPLPATPTDPVYEVFAARSETKFWITRRTGGSCTCLVKNGSGDLLEEAPCGEELPAFCQSYCVNQRGGGDFSEAVHSQGSLDTSGGEKC